MNYGMYFSSEMQKRADAIIVPGLIGAGLGYAGEHSADKTDARAALHGAGRAIGGGLVGILPGMVPLVGGLVGGALAKSAPGAILGGATALAGVGSMVAGNLGGYYGAYKQDKPWWYYPMRGATFGLYK